MTDFRDDIRMMSHSNNSTRRPIRFLFENSLFLIAGAIVAP